MSSANMNPDTAWIVGSVLTASITSAAGYLTARRGAQKAGTAEHTATRDQLSHSMGEVLGRLDAIQDQVSEVRQWQAEHTTEHAVARITRASAVEYRKGEGC